MTATRLDLCAAALLFLAVLTGAGCSTRRPATSAMRTVESADEAVNMCTAFACEP